MRRGRPSSSLLLGTLGLGAGVPLGRLERWMHAVSGVVIALSGVAVLLGA